MPPQIGEPVAEGVGRVPGSFVNAYVVQDLAETYLIDTTMSKTAKPLVRAFALARTPLAGVRAVLLTHQHADHVGGAAAIVDAAHPPVACHPADAPVIEGKERAKMPFLFRLFLHARPVRVSTSLNDGDTIGPFRVMFVPGHTPGEIALYHTANRWLFSGDSVVERRGTLTLPSPRVASNLSLAVRSLNAFRNLDVEILFPGHGKPVARDVRGQLNALIDRAPHQYLRAQN